MKTHLSNAFLLAFAAGERACHRWPESFSLDQRGVLMWDLYELYSYAYVYV